MKNKKIKRFQLFAYLLLSVAVIQFSLFNSASAQVPSAEIQIGNGGADSSVAAVGNNFIVAYKGGNFDRIQVKQYDSATTALSGNFQVSNSIGQWTAIAANDSGEFVVAWATNSYDELDGSGCAIYARRLRINSSNQIEARGGEFRVNTNGYGDQRMPSVGIDSNGNFVVIWENFYHPSGGGIFGQRYDSNGDALGSEFRVHQSYASMPSVAVADDGSFAAVWHSAYLDGENYFNVYGQRFNAAGEKTGNVFRVNTSIPGGQISPRIASDASGNFVVSYLNEKALNSYTYDVYARRYSAAGSPLGSEFRVNTTNSDSANRISIALNRETNEFVIVWDGNMTPDSGGVKGRLYDSSGAAASPEFKIDGRPNSYELNPAVAIGSNGNFFVSYGSWSNPSGILGRLFIVPPPPTITHQIADGDVAGLINAINAANASSGPDVINLAQGGTYTLTEVNSGGAWEGPTGLPLINSKITINGNGSTIQRSNAQGIPAFRILYNYGDLTLNEVVIKGGKSAQGHSGYVGGGGGIRNQGKLLVVKSTITENSGSEGGSNEGGGILNYSGTLTVINSTISHNTGWGGYGGGGILNFTHGTNATTTISNSTIFENQSLPLGRGDAIADNFSVAGSLTVKNSIVASPSRNSTGDDCYLVPLNSLGHNIYSDSSCNANGNLGDQVVTDLQLGALAINGGLTPTHALLSGNPAINAVPLADCKTAAGISLATDQRGIARPKGAACDIGSYELSDLTAPVLTLPADFTVEATNSSGMTVSYTASATDDIDVNVSVNCVPASGSFFAYGLTTVTCNATDQSGNSATGSFNVTVQDTTAPVISNMPGNLIIEAANNNGAVAVWNSPTAIDSVDADVNLTCSPASGSVFAIGTTTVTCSATDDFNNSSSATFTVTIQDTTAPTINNVPSNQTLEATSATGAAATWANPTATDAVNGAREVICAPASGSTFVIGMTTVTCNTSDTSGNLASVTFTVTVQDTTAPTISAASPIVTEAATSQGANVTYTQPSATDVVDGTVTVDCTPAPGSLFALGVTIVHCTAIDAAGNSSETDFTVTVQDTTAPIINAPQSNITLEATAPSGAAANWAAMTAADTVDGTLNVICDRASGSTFALGTTTVHCSAVDAAGNAAAHDFTVTIQDTSAPNLTVPGNQTLYTATAGASFDWTATATDVVSGNVAVVCSPASPATFNLGTTQVNCSATDAAGNTVNGSFSVTVLDNVAPSIAIASPINNGNYALGQSILANYGCADNGSGVANCTGTNPNGAPIDTNSVGTKIFTVNATDAAGNQSSRIVTYTVGYGVVALFDQTKAHNSGSNIPIKLKIVNADGNNQSNQAIEITALRVEPGNLPANSSGNSNQSNVFSFDSAKQSYQYNLKTEESWSAGTYQLIFRVAGDPVEHSISFIIR